MTPYQVIYDAFLAKIREDEWCNEIDIEMILADWRAILESALPLFKFPRINLSNRDDCGFDAQLTNEEIQILANLMKEEWLSRTINTWENVRVMYDERDFSQANLLDKFIKLLEHTQDKNKRLQKQYSRAVVDKDGIKKPFDYTKLAGGD